MKIEQIYTGCLAHSAYYIESNGEAAILDPLREVEPYIRRAKEDNAVIKYVFETHFHADFVSGHLDLSGKTGAPIIYGPTAQPGFTAIIAIDNQEFQIGEYTLVVLHTPGHTMESCCYLLKDKNKKTIALFTGDTLFIGDVGRPDLAQKAANLTREELAGLLFDSLRKRIMPLPDSLIIYPGHGAGSACGKNMSTETTDTLGHQKQYNYALRADMTREEFIKEVLSGLTAPPAYFPLNAERNKQGYESIDRVLQRGNIPLTTPEFELMKEQDDVLVLDTRNPQVFAPGFIPGSINIGIDGNFALWVGALIPGLDHKILLVAEAGREQEIITRLSRVGYDHCIGYLKGGFEKWKEAGKETDCIESISADALADTIVGKQVNLIDVRKASEFEGEHVEGAINLPLDYINESMKEIDPGQPYFVHCAGGYRSMIFISILKARGYENLTDIKEGFAAMKKTGRFPISTYAYPQVNGINIT